MERRAGGGKQGGRREVERGRREKKKEKTVDGKCVTPLEVVYVQTVDSIKYIELGYM